jgi:hypothetical protein
VNDNVTTWNLEEIRNRRSELLAFETLIKPTGIAKDMFQLLIEPYDAFITNAEVTECASHILEKLTINGEVSSNSPPMPKEKIINRIPAPDLDSFNRDIVYTICKVLGVPLSTTRTQKPKSFSTDNIIAHRQQAQKIGAKTAIPVSTVDMIEINRCVAAAKSKDKSLVPNWDGLYNPKTFIEVEKAQ